MSSRQGSGSSEKRQFWELAVETWRDSGMSVRQFCTGEGLSEAAFYFWRRRLSRAAAQSNAPSSSGGPGDTPPPFIEISVRENHPAPLELVLTSGNVLRIGAAADAAVLHRVVAVLHEAGLC